MQNNRILLHYAEVGLKGQNRRDFELQLRRNIKHRLLRANVHWPVHPGHNRITVRIPKAPHADVFEVAAALREVAGIASVAPAVFVSRGDVRWSGEPSQPHPIEAIVVEIARASWRAQASFAVRVNRGDKGFPLRSNELARRLGAAIIERTDWSRVDLSHPDQSFYVDIYPEGIYIYGHRLRGFGGLPVFTAGPVLSLLSGGIDSPVAAFLMAKRGCRVDFLHLSATHLAPEALPENLVGRIAKRLSIYTLRSRLFFVPYTHFDLALLDQPPCGFEMILFRRFMARLGARIVERQGGQALVVGDSLGQVASQTLENIVSHSQATNLPILRPLIGLDKQEIIERARAIGTYELSTEPYKDCCALLSRHPRTKSRADQLEQLEARLFPNYEALIERTLGDMQILTFDTGELVEVNSSQRAHSSVE
ncbi:MAG: tRNA 4-thiouridine(8) synthase ThiI [Nitrococcus sp.]|nr:tRNA 4-thiouridine(8) synthase ThiI [Nitrococcus sp.]